MKSAAREGAPSPARRRAHHSENRADTKRDVTRAGVVPLIYAWTIGASECADLRIVPAVVGRREEVDRVDVDSRRLHARHCKAVAELQVLQAHVGAVLHEHVEESVAESATIVAHHLVGAVRIGRGVVRVREDFPWHVARLSVQREEGHPLSVDDAAATYRRYER